MTESPVGAPRTGQLPGHAGPKRDATKGEEDPPQMTEKQHVPDRHVPWQMEWKHPRWISSSSSSSSSSSPPSRAESTKPKSRGANGDDRSRIVGVTTAHLSQTEISYVLGFDKDGDSKKPPPKHHKGWGEDQFDNKRKSKSNSNSNSNSNRKSPPRSDRHYLLSVTLLGWWCPRAIAFATSPLVDDGQEGSSGISPTTANNSHNNSELPISLASEVLIEILEVPASATTTAANPDDTNTPATIVIRSKRLRWPESIFDAHPAANAQPAVTTRNGSNGNENENETKTKTKTKTITAGKPRGTATKRPKKNFLASVFLPLMGIDEEDEFRVGDGPDDPGESKQSPSSRDDDEDEKDDRDEPPPTHGIVSATLCRPPANDGLTVSETKEILGLMSFGGDGNDGNDNDEGGPTRSKAKSARLTSGGVNDEQDEAALVASREAPTTIDGALAFACVSTRGEVFVYDPIKLLLGIEDDSGLGKEEKEARKGLEEATSFFFGQELFRNLQETWRPLAEPSTRIHLSLFQHDHHPRQLQQQQQQWLRQQSGPRTLDKLVHNNRELSDWTQSVLSRDGDTRPGGTTASRGSHKNRDRDSDAFSVVTSATGALGAAVQDSALEFQSRIDDTFSMISYLFNPLLEPATLKDRTVRNQPLSMTVAGAACVVVIGTGLRTRATEPRSAAAAGVARSTDRLIGGGSEPASKHSDNDGVSVSASASVSSQPSDTEKPSLDTIENEANAPGNPFADSAGDGNEGDRDSDGDSDSDSDNVHRTVGGTTESNGNPKSSPSIDHPAGATIHAGDGDAAEKPSSTNPFSDNEDVSAPSASPPNPFDEQEDKDVLPPSASSHNALDETDDHSNPNANDNANLHGDEKSSDIAPSWLEDPGDDDDELKQVTVTDGTKTDELRSKSSEWWEDLSDKESHDDTNDGDQAPSSSATQSSPHNATEPEKDSTEDAEDEKEDDENSQRHYFDGYDEDFDEHKSRQRGGFVTFLSTACWSETRTLFVPFVPIRVSHVSQWNGMELLWVVGHFESLLIRMDSTGPVAVSLRDVLRMEKANEEIDPFDSSTGVNPVSDEFQPAAELSPLSVKKFQILQIDQPVTGSVSPRLLCASSTGVDPPSILELYVDTGSHLMDQSHSLRDPSESFRQPLRELQHNQPGLVLSKTLGYVTPQGTVALCHLPSHVAKITIDHRQTNFKEHGAEKGFVGEMSIWAEHGQGWSLIGINHRSYFICWEGSTLLQGAHVQQFKDSFAPTADQNIFTSNVLPLRRTQQVSVEKPSSSYYSFNPMEDSGMDPADAAIKRDQVSSSAQPFSSSSRELHSINEFQPSLLGTMEHDGQFDSAFSTSANDSMGIVTNSSRSTISSRRQYSEYLLQQCSSWTQLEDTMDDRVMFERQEPVLCLRHGSAGSPQSVLTLRQLVVENGISSPFQQVLAWLAKKKNFFVAAGIALDLLKDADSLYHLWKHAEMIDEEDEETKLFGLLDGITPVLLDDGDHTTNKCKHSVTATHLSEMTVGCFIKGGPSMAKTLVRFLEVNKLYDPTRVSLMLSLTIINLLSEHSATDQLSAWKREDVDFNSLLWPIESLLAIGTEREYLTEVLTLLNNTIPDELRHRVREEEEGNKQRFPMSSIAFTKKLIQLILDSDPIAIDILMGFVDDRSQATFWHSLDHKTSLALSLMKIDSSYPFLKQPEVRSWMREELETCVNELPTIWLQELTCACLQNAGCDLNSLQIESDNDDDLLTPSSNLGASESTQRMDNLSLNTAFSDVGKVNSGACIDDSVEKLNDTIQNTRNALLVASDESLFLDYDLLIPTLLLLENRGVHWLPSQSSSQSRSYPAALSTGSITLDEESFVSTQDLVNAACYLAGRATVSGYGGNATRKSIREGSEGESLLFVSFDSKSAMKQCFKANNVVAGAYLIGGTNGFILHVCDILHKGTGMSIADAESFLINDRLDLSTVEESKAERSPFELTSRHEKLLLLLDEHVLRIKTFGDFDSTHNRGKVDPVFAARSILRAWLLLSFGDEAKASKRLGDWLGGRLGIPAYRSSASSNEMTPRSKTGSNFSSFGTHTDCADPADPNADETFTASRLPSIHGLACASLAQSLLWPQNKPSSVPDNDRINQDGTLPLAHAMKFDTKLLLELCESCLGLVESVPPDVVRRLNWAVG